MKRQLLLCLLLLILGLTAAAQKISKPTLASTEPTAAQKFIIEQGIALHDAKKYDAAIEQYLDVLEESPDCTFAMYELALSYFKKPDLDKALETAFKGTKYKSKELSLFYGMIANTWDDQGKSEDAIRLYLDGIKFLKDEKGSEQHLSSLYYNLGVTYTRQKKYVESREALKNAVANNFAYPSPNYVLAEVYYTTKYKVPALLAAARLISLEINSQRTNRAVAIFRDILKPAQKDEKNGSINIFMDMNAPKDEGEFMVYDLLLGTLTTVRTDEDKDKSDEEIFAEAVDSMIVMLAGDKKLAKTFVGKTYIPYMAEMKRLGYSKNFAYIVLQKDGNKNVEKWLLENKARTIEFIEWARSYNFPKQ